ncbi:nuclear transport factor 2 family protein [Miltoncostaea marina]|uniref:nuclear transport factor 2 family protein n=1 Tax=Miltoncostaea marina TaxID=2843215 RepID=UPI001C3E06AA|nr:nuclear transport factor 2 family protein [Miltoncostaea marina]
MTTAGGHPSDEDRERAALPVLERLLAASRARDLDALAGCYDQDVVWLAAEGTTRGRGDAVARHSAIAAAATGWSPPQQAGAKAALRWSGADGLEGVIVVEVRRGRVIFAATG